MPKATLYLLKGDYKGWEICGFIGFQALGWKSFKELLANHCCSLELGLPERNCRLMRDPSVKVPVRKNHVLRSFLYKESVCLLRGMYDNKLYCRQMITC